MDMIRDRVYDTPCSPDITDISFGGELGLVDPIHPWKWTASTLVIRVNLIPRWKIPETQIVEIIVCALDQEQPQGSEVLWCFGFHPGQEIGRLDWTAQAIKDSPWILDGGKLQRLSSGFTDSLPLWRHNQSVFQTRNHWLADGLHPPNQPESLSEWLRNGRLSLVLRHPVTGDQASYFSQSYRSASLFTLDIVFVHHAFLETGIHA